ncbi:hypothetical protein PMAYCL1PPCAC_22870, partial [Pristionchus mayeri]
MLNETLEDAIFYSESVYLRVMLAVRTPLLCIALVLLVILHLNRHKFVAHHSLSVLLNCHFVWTFILCFITAVDHFHTIFLLIFMYQITENLRMLRIMLPVVWSHVIITTGACQFFIVGTMMQISTRNFPLFEDSINVLFLQGIFMPLFFLRQ